MIDGQPKAALSKFERAYDAMDDRYLDDQRQIGVWQVTLGMEIGNQWETLGNQGKAEHWYRKVLEIVPFNPEATSALATLLNQTGRLTEASALCAKLSARLSGNASCSL